MSIHRLLVALLLSSVLCTPGQALAQNREPAVLKLTLTPAAPGKPALEHRLHMDVADRKPGDAATLYMAALLLHNPSDQANTADELLKLPLDQLTPDAVARQSISQGAMDMLYLAARREQCNWEMPYREHGFSTLLPHLGPMRDLARVIALKSRIALRDKDFPEAVRNIRTGLAMSQHLNEEAVLVQQLVGAAISLMMLDRVDEMVATPGSPNLYWSLAQLPNPYHDIVPTLGWERLALAYVFPNYDDGNLENLSAAEFSKGTASINAIVGSQGKVDHLGAVVLALKAYPEAKKFLLERGMSADKVEALEPHQAIAMAMARSYRETSDELFKWQGLPYWQSREVLRNAAREIDKVRHQQPWNPLLQLLPALNMAHQRLVMVDRKIASLRLVEALRAHAAANGGRFPASLEDLKDTPAPLDPMTGQPFQYELRGELAIIDCTTQERGRPAQGWRYELTIAK